MANSGIPYEKLAQQIFQEILCLSGVHNVKVEHDVRLAGKTVSQNGVRTEHQIDVYWEFELGGIVYKTVIQAKDWAQNVPQSEVLKFKEILNDLPGQPRGIMVTRTGFQKGAQETADANGIETYILRHPTPKDLENRFVKLEIAIDAYAPNLEITGIEADMDWVRSTGFTEQLTFGPVDARTVFLYGEDGLKGSSISDVANSYMPKEYKEVPPTDFHHVFNEPTFIETHNPALPELKLLGFTGRYSLTLHRSKATYDFSDMMTFILKSISGDKTYFVDPSGNVRKVG